MKTIGFVKSELENEDRRAILPADLKEFSHSSALYFEEGYGEALSISDAAYEEMGVKIVPRAEALKQDIICDLKIGRADYLADLKANQTIFGWVHAENNQELVDLLVKKELTAIAWEDMFDRGRHVFWKNNLIAGEAAILHAYTLFGKLPEETKVALIGRGNVSMGAYKILSALGAEVKIYNRKTVENLADELGEFDLLVNGVLWDKSRDDHLIYREDLKKFNLPAMIVDISADEDGAIETSKPTFFTDPTYEVDGVIHYVVNHTPTIFSHSVSRSISKELVNYLEILMKDLVEENSVLAEATIIKDGKIIDEKIKGSRNN